MPLTLLLQGIAETLKAFLILRTGPEATDQDKGAKAVL
jgi:hypothetical protein